MLFQEWRVCNRGIGFMVYLCFFAFLWTLIQLYLAVTRFAIPSWLFTVQFMVTEFYCLLPRTTAALSFATVSEPTLTSWLLSIYVKPVYRIVFFSEIFCAWDRMTLHRRDRISCFVGFFSNSDGSGIQHHVVNWHIGVTWRLCLQRQRLS
jgi:hypothetical protein